MNHLTDQILVNQLGFTLGNQALEDTFFANDPRPLLEASNKQGIHLEDMVSFMASWSYETTNRSKVSQFPSLQKDLWNLSKDAIVDPLQKEAYMRYIVTDSRILDSSKDYDFSKMDVSLYEMESISEKEETYKQTR